MYWPCSGLVAPLLAGRAGQHFWGRQASGTLMPRDVLSEVLSAAEVALQRLPSRAPACFPAALPFVNCRGLV